MRANSAPCEFFPFSEEIAPSVGWRCYCKVRHKNSSVDYIIIIPDFMDFHEFKKNV